MKYIIEDIRYRAAKKALEANGFGLDERFDDFDQPLMAEIWTGVNDEGTPCGFKCGRLLRYEYSIAQRFSLDVEDFYLRDGSPERFISVIRALQETE